MKRKIPLVNGEIYHILSKSIAGYEIFNTQADYLRMQHLFRYYQKETQIRFSDFLLLKGVRIGFNAYLAEYNADKNDLVQIIAYCLMPTHFHLILKQLENDGISKFIGNILNSYTRYFNVKHKRKGPLWEAKFENVLVGSDEQLRHLTRYIHLNPTTALLAKKPEEWLYSSYKEYLGTSEELALCDYRDLIDIDPKSYRKFVNNRISYQQGLAKIKAQMLD